MYKILYFNWYDTHWTHNGNDEKDEDFGVV